MTVFPSLVLADTDILDGSNSPLIWYSVFDGIVVIEIPVNDSVKTVTSNVAEMFPEVTVIVLVPEKLLSYPDNL